VRLQIQRELYAARPLARASAPWGACDNPRVSTPAPASPRTLGASPYLLLTLTPLFWAVNWIFGRGLAPDIPPMAMTFFRWFFALLILAPFALPHVRRDFPTVRRYWKTLLFLGAIGIGSHKPTGSSSTRSSR